MNIDELLASAPGSVQRMSTADECAKDAERYRWLRRNGCPFAETDPAWDSPEALDARIDEIVAFEAMNAHEQSAYICKKMGFEPQ